MNKITIEIKTGNSAFHEYGGVEEEVARILMKLAKDLKDGRTPEKLMDYNGNGVGKVVYK